MSHAPVRHLPSRVLCLVTDVELAGGTDPLLQKIEQGLDGGVNMVQIRANHLPADELTNLASRVVALVASRALVVVNGPLEAASESKAHGVHLPESTRRAGRIADSAHERGLLVGRSVHSIDAARQAVEEGADYLIAGTVFESRSHPGGPTIGPEGLIDMVRAASGRPVVGIGGISVQNAPAVMAAGAAGVAVIGAIIGSPDPKLAAVQLSTAILAS